MFPWPIFQPGICTGAAATVSTYYLYRLPQLFGFNPLRNNGSLVDLTPYLPRWGMLALNLVTTAFFFWVAWRGKGKRGWSMRPPYALPENPSASKKDHFTMTAKYSVFESSQGPVSKSWRP